LIPSKESPLKSSSFSHAGLGGKKNEDRHSLTSYRLSEKDSKQSLFAIVADGRGENRAGEVAAQIVVDTVGRSVAESDASQPKSILHAAIIQAGQHVLTQSEMDAEKRGMGSTCLCVWIVDNRLYTASVGNSRLFLLRQSRLQQLNVVFMAAEDEDVTEESEEVIEESPPDELQDYLGSRMRAAADFRLVLRPGGEANAEKNQGVRLQANDRLLLCTDGLSKALNDQEIAELLGRDEIEATAETLVQAALANKAEDNLSAVVLGVPPARPVGETRRRGWKPVLAVLAFLLLLVTFSLLGWFYFGQGIDRFETPQPSPVSTLTALPTSVLE
jgi:protein phosphatase